MGAMQPIHWIIVLLVVLLLFGAKKLPDAARGLGRSMRIFKSEMKEMQTDGEQPQQQQGELPQSQPQAAAYPTGAAAGQATPAAAPVQNAQAGQAGSIPPAPQPVWDPETQQYVLPNQQPGQNPQAQ